MKQWILSALALSLLLMSCSKQEKVYRPKTQELRLNLHSEPPTLDPRKATDTVSISVLKMCFEGLTRIDPSGHPIPAAATKIEISSDQTRYTFTLRETIWADGKPVTAYDFEKTWKTILDPLFPCEFASDLYILKNGQAAKEKKCSLDQIGIKALDAQTLQVDLEHPIPYFLEALSTHAFFPCPSHITEQYPDWTKEHYIGNGVFYIKEWKHLNVINLEKNPRYWDRDSVRLEKISLALIEDESTELSMFENGELDWAGYPFSSLPSDALATLSQKKELCHYSIAGTYFYIFNTKQFPFTNSNIRKAFSLAINRAEIVTNITQMHQIPATGMVPPMMWQDPPTYFQDHDVKEAKRFFALGLKELGITADELPPLTLSYNTMSAHHKIAQAIQAQWLKALGVRVHLENKEWKVFLDELKHRQFQIARMGGLANINDPSTFLDYYRYLSSSNNHSQWTNPHFTELLEQADLSTDPEQRLELLKKAEQLLIDEMPIAPIYFYTGAFLKKPYVKGVYLSELNDADFKWAYVETHDQVPL